MTRNIHDPAADLLDAMLQFRARHPDIVEHWMQLDDPEREPDEGD